MSNVKYKKGNGKHHCSQNLPWCIVVCAIFQACCANFLPVYFLYLAVKKIDIYDE